MASMRVWSLFLASCAIHALGMLGLSLSARNPPAPRVDKVKVALRQLPKPEEKKVEKPPEVPKPQPPPPEPKPKVKKKAKPQKPEKVIPRHRRKPKPNQTPPKKPPPPVLGVTPESVGKGGKGPTVPVGNTMMTEDKDIVAKPEDLDVQADLSADARLIAETLDRPEYTEEALDEEIEGMFIVQVFVDPEGRVAQAELQVPIGFGMDERVIESVRRARFHPRRDRSGHAIPGWTEIRFRLYHD